jgi:hypothetical protein
VLRFLVQVVLVILLFPPIFETVKNVPVSLPALLECLEKKERRARERRKERSGYSYDWKNETDRQTELTIDLAKDLGDAKRTCERPSLGEGLD